MPADNIIHYILYLVILIIFFVVLKSPKNRHKGQSHKELEDKNKREDSSEKKVKPQRGVRNEDTTA